MDKKTRIKRGETVLAMEHMARCINDEELMALKVARNYF